MRLAPAVLVLAALMAVAACSQTGSSGEPAAGTTASPSASSPGPSPGTPTRPQLTELPVSPLPPNPGDYPPGSPAAGSSAEAAVRDLARRTGVAPEEVSVVRVEEVTWNDSSLGCPKPGTFYAQVITPGSLIVLETGGRSYEYHAADGRPPVLCERPQPPGAPSS